MKNPHPYPVVPACDAGDLAQQTVLLIFKAKKGPHPLRIPTMLRAVNMPHISMLMQMY